MVFARFQAPLHEGPRPFSSPPDQAHLHRSCHLTEKHVDEDTPRRPGPGSIATTGSRKLHDVPDVPESYEEGVMITARIFRVPHCRSVSVLSAPSPFHLFGFLRPFRCGASRARVCVFYLPSTYLSPSGIGLRSRPAYFHQKHPQWSRR